MKVICIDNSGYENELILGKEYTAYRNNLLKGLCFYSVDNEIGEARMYRKGRFVPVFKHRQNRLKDLMD